MYECLSPLVRISQCQQIHGRSREAKCVGLLVVGVWFCFGFVFLKSDHPFLLVAISEVALFSVLPKRAQEAPVCPERQSHPQPVIVKHNISRAKVDNLISCTTSQ